MTERHLESGMHELCCLEWRTTLGDLAALSSARPRSRLSRVGRSVWRGRSGSNVCAGALWVFSGLLPAPIPESPSAAGSLPFDGL